MANTVTQTTLYGGGNSRYVTRLINIVSDGSNESLLRVFQNSTFINDATAGTLVYVDYSASASCGIQLYWDQTTDFFAFGCNPLYAQKKKFEKFGGIRNPAGAGATGDLLLTTTGLALGVVVTLLITIRQA